MHHTSRAPGLSIAPLLVMGLLALGAAAPASAGSSIVGQTANAGVRLDGVQVPSGTTLISPAVVRTGDSAAIIHLRNGSVVAVLPRSIAHFEADGSGMVMLAVEAGEVAYADLLGEVVNLCECGEAMWAFQEGQIGEGAATAEGQERLCELKDSTPAKFQLCTLTNPDSAECSWTLLMVPVSEGPTYLDISAVYAGEDRNDLGLSENCRPEPIAGMSTLAKVGIGIGAAVLAAVIIEEIDDEDKPPASPITP
jgi:hypothetical protein